MFDAMGHERLTAIDSSFLRVETPAAHMHVAWKGTFRPAPDRPAPTLRDVRALVAGRLRYAPRFRQRVAFPPARLAEPVWVDDERFDLDYHVRLLGGPGELVSRLRFGELADEFLGRQLDRSRAMWQIGLVPRLRGGGVGLVMKLHHAMVDGKSAVALALLLLDVDPDGDRGVPDAWRPDPAPTGTRLALDALRDGGGESLRMAAGLARMAGSPARGVRLAETLRRAALSAGEDLLRPAPASFLNVPIGPRRRLVTHAAPVDHLLELKQRHGATLNDVAVTVVAGALRRLAHGRGTHPLPLKVMVPVSVRAADEAAAVGNRISFAFIELPLHVAGALERLGAVRAATARFKEAGRAEGTGSVLAAVGRLPEPLKDRAARLAASPRTYNLTVSNIPGPRDPVYLLGARLVEAYPVVPLSQGHALSIGMFSYCDRLFFGGCADPEALPDAGRLPGALNAARLELLRESRAQLHASSPGVRSHRHAAGVVRTRGALAGAR